MWNNKYNNMTNEDQIWTLCINHDDIDYNNSSKIILEDAINKEINDNNYKKFLNEDNPDDIIIPDTYDKESINSNNR